MNATEMGLTRAASCSGAFCGQIHAAVGGSLNHRDDLCKKMQKGENFWSRSNCANGRANQAFALFFFSLKRNSSVRIEDILMFNLVCFVDQLKSEQEDAKRGGVWGSPWGHPPLLEPKHTRITTGHVVPTRGVDSTKAPCCSFTSLNAEHGIGGVTRLLCILHFFISRVE